MQHRGSASFTREPRPEGRQHGNPRPTNCGTHHTQVHAETLLAGKEVGPRVTWAGQAHPSAYGSPPCSDHASRPSFGGESRCTTPMFRPSLKRSTYIPPPCGLPTADCP
ncbi:hypothetical protein NN561_005031 [Cricetulus griseus]